MKDKPINNKNDLDMNNQDSIKNFLHTCVLKQWILNIPFEKSLESELLKIIPHDKQYKITLRNLYMIYKKNGKIFWHIKTPVTEQNAEQLDYAANDTITERINGKNIEFRVIRIFMHFPMFKNLIDFMSKYGKISQYDAVKKLCGELKIKPIEYIKALKDPKNYTVERIENLSKNEKMRQSLQNKDGSNELETAIRHPVLSFLSGVRNSTRKEAIEMLKPNISFKIIKNE